MIRPPGFRGAAFGTAADGDGRLDPAARRRMAGELGIPDEWAYLHQVHGSRVRSAAAPGLQGDGDALFTTLPQLPLAVGTADCLPVVLEGPGGVGLAHMGWRGAAAGVVAALRAAMEAAGWRRSGPPLGPGSGRAAMRSARRCWSHCPRFAPATRRGGAGVDLAAAAAAGLAGLEVWHVGGLHLLRRRLSLLPPRRRPGDGRWRWHGVPEARRGPRAPGRRRRPGGAGRERGHAGGGQQGRRSRPAPGRLRRRAARLRREPRRPPSRPVGASCPGDARWHFIGRLQGNKVRVVRPGAHLLHSLDRADLAGYWAKGPGLPPPVLVQVNVSGEPAKAGVAPRRGGGAGGGGDRARHRGAGAHDHPSAGCFAGRGRGPGSAPWPGCAATWRPRWPGLDGALDGHERRLRGGGGGRCDPVAGRTGYLWTVPRRAESGGSRMAKLWQKTLFYLGLVDEEEPGYDASAGAVPGWGEAVSPRGLAPGAVGDGAGGRR